jgi:heterodisulfide reductase subunit B
LESLNDYLDDTEDSEIRREVETHINECPNCWVVFNTTQKTLKVFKGTEPQDIPKEVHDKLMSRLQECMSQQRDSG